MKLNRLFNVLQLVFVVLFTIGVTGYFAPLGVDSHHDGILIKPAIDVLHGKMLFADTFTQYGALTTLVQAWALHFFGEYLIVIKYLTVFFYGTIALVLWLFWKKFIPPLLSTLSILIWVGLFGFYDYWGLLPWSSVYALLCQMLALYLLILWARHKKQWMLGIVGVFAALAFWFRQPTGIYIFGAVILFWAVAKIKKIQLPSLLPLFLGFFLVHFVFFVWLIKNNALDAWWLQSILAAYGFQNAVATQYRFPIFQISQLLPPSESAVSIWVIFPAVVLYQGYKLLIIKKLSVKNIQLLATVSMCLFSWLQYYPMGDPAHALWAATPMIGFYLYFAWNNAYKNKKKFIVFFLLLLFLAPDVFNRMRDAKKKLLTPYYTFSKETILKGMKETKVNYDYFLTIIDKIQLYEKSHPNTFVVTLATDALYSLFGKNDINCSRFTVGWEWDLLNTNITKEYKAATKACIDKFKPLVITDRNHYNPPFYTPFTPRPNTGHTDYLLAPSLP